MDLEHSHLASQRVLKQRNALAVTAIVLGIGCFATFTAASTRDREVVLLPIATSPLTISSDGVPKSYMEMVTRDAALLALNRSPETLSYWMEHILELTDPRARGALKRDLLKIVDEQRGSQITQFFTIDRIKVDPANLTSEVGGMFHTVAGSKEVTSEHKLFRFTWSYTGLSLKLLGFGAVQKTDKPS